MKSRLFCVFFFLIFLFFTDYNLVNIAARTISDESVGAKMSSKMIELIPEKMSEMGLVASAKRVFGQDSYFVIKL